MIERSWKDHGRETREKGAGAVLGVHAEQRQTRIILIGKLQNPQEPRMPEFDFHGQMREFAKGLLDWQERMRPTLEAIDRGMQQVALQIQESIERHPGLLELLKMPGEELAARLAEIPERMRLGLQALAEAGWYLDPEMGLSEVTEFGRGLTAATEERLIQHFLERLPEIQAALERRHPNRARILSRAFAAHAREEYELSVPVFLTQADGICYEILNASPYRERDRETKLVPYIRSLESDTFPVSALQPLTKSIPLTANARERGESFTHLNRHQVLHGESVDYGTRVNSLKAISFLNYLSYALTDYVAQSGR
jgi:hypothetical protein